MKRVLFFLLYLVTLAIPAAVYFFSISGGLDRYSLSVILGTIAFIMVCNQFILASRPRFAVAALGTKGLLSFHGTIPVFILVCAGIHKILKEAEGFSDDTLQGILGGSTWWLFLVVTILTILLMAQTFWMKNKQLAAFKKWVYAKTGLNYKIMRLLHNVTVFAAIILMIHVLLASTASFAYNPVGILLMAGWMAVSLVTYFVYRLRGRVSGGKK
jgi:predicted ferric reductase